MPGQSHKVKVLSSGETRLAKCLKTLTLQKTSMKNRNAPTNLQSETYSKVPTVALAKNCMSHKVDYSIISNPKIQNLFALENWSCVNTVDSNAFYGVQTILGTYH